MFIIQAKVSFPYYKSVELVGSDDVIFRCPFKQIKLPLFIADPKLPFLVEQDYIRDQWPIL
jgi:hypothetical protein